jgi:predicted TIM-barrel enzyme
MTKELKTIASSTILPVLVGSGVREDNVATLLSVADGSSSAAR